MFKNQYQYAHMILIWFNACPVPSILSFGIESWRQYNGCNSYVVRKRHLFCSNCGYVRHKVFRSLYWSHWFYKHGSLVPWGITPTKLHLLTNYVDFQGIWSDQEWYQVKPSLEYRTMAFSPSWIRFLRLGKPRFLVFSFCDLSLLGHS